MQRPQVKKPVRLRLQLQHSCYSQCQSAAYVQSHPVQETKLTRVSQLACLETAVAASPCSPTDIACSCSNMTLQAQVQLCVAGSCTLRESLSTHPHIQHYTEWDLTSCRHEERVVHPLSGALPRSIDSNRVHRHVRPCGCSLCHHFADERPSCSSRRFLL